MCSGLLVEKGSLRSRLPSKTCNHRLSYCATRSCAPSLSHGYGHCIPAVLSQCGEWSVGLSAVSLRAGLIAGGEFGARPGREPAAHSKDPEIGRFRSISVRRPLPCQVVATKPFDF